MALLTLFSKAQATLLKLPSGSFTVDREGRVVVGTIPSSFPTELLRLVAQEVLAAFRSAETVQLPLSEVIINYASLKITARELRGGAVVFLAPQTHAPPSPSKS